MLGRVVLVLVEGHVQVWEAVVQMNGTRRLQLKLFCIPKCRDPVQLRQLLADVRRLVLSAKLGHQMFVYPVVNIFLDLLQAQDISI